MSTQEYIASFQPRVSGFPHTAPRYDEVSKPVTAPYPAACMSMGQRCECYTQQGTKMETSPDICAFIVRRGYFVDWQQPEGSRRGREDRRNVDKPQPLLARGKHD